MKPSTSNPPLQLLKLRREKILARISRLDRKINRTELRLTNLPVEVRKEAA